MNINYLSTALVIIAAIGLLIFLIRKNRKDEKKFEQEMNREVGEPEVHKGKGEKI